MKRRLFSLLLALSMVISVIPFAAFAEETDTTEINYVSIGDSMTNGYGLDGYDAEAGVYDYGYASYANQFAAALAGYTTEEFYDKMETAEQGFGITFEKNGVTVNHAQLGLSAARPEDVNFLLNLDYDEPEVVELLDKYPEDDKVYWKCGDHSGVAFEDIVYCAACKWNPEDYPQFDLPGWGVQNGSGKSVDDYEAWWTLVQGEAWNDLIGYGDYWTWKELTEDYRFGTVATYIKSIFGTDTEKNRAAELMVSRPAKPRDDGSNGEETVYVAKHFQEQIANADVISLGIGNGNFGVWLMGRITTVLMDYDGVAANGVYDIEEALNKLEPELQEKAKEILTDVEPYVDRYVTTMMGDSLEADVKKSIQDVCTYAVVSFMANYKGMVERILELNPDVKIVMLGLMNTYAGDDAMAAEDQVTIGNILDVMFPPLNAFIAGLPAYMQSIGKNEAYKDAEFYYAEEYEIECLIQNFGDEDFYAWKGVARDRFVTGVVGECDCGGGHNTDNAESCTDWDYGIFWELLDGFNMGGITIERITPYQIKVYEALDTNEKVAFAAQDKDKAGSIAVYLAIEDAICKSGRLAPVTLSTLTGLELGNPAILDKALGNFTVEQEKVIADYYADAKAGLIELGIPEEKITQTNIDDMSMILSLPVALSNALWTDTDLCSMLAVVARNKLGNGLGAHPSVDGHAALSEEMIGAYGNHTAEDEVDDRLENIEHAPVVKNIISDLSDTGYLTHEQILDIAWFIYDCYKENDTLSEKQKAQLADKIYTIVLNREDLTAEDKIEIITIIYTVLDEHDYVDANVTIAYMKAYAAAKEKGYIDDAALALDAVKGIVELAKDYVDMYPGSEELKTLLLEELDNTEETLDALIGLLDNEVLDEAAWAEMKALEDELNKHIETITELAEAMGVELDDCIADLEDAAKVYADMIAEVAEAAYDYAVESIEGFADDYAEWVESVGDEIDEVNPVLGDAVRKFLTEVPADSLSILYAYGDEAVAKLVSEAVKAYGDMETVIADLAYVLNTYGEEIYEAVKGNDEIEELIEDIKDQLAEVKELVEWINDHPFEGAYNASVADKEAALQTAYDQLVYLYNRLYDVAMSVIADVDEEAAEALEAALDALQEVLSIAGESAEGYLGWLADHGEAMGCALLTALLDNIEELLTTACPIVDELIWALLAQVDQAVLEFLPVADQWMYDWLYNNPDKVIAFFTEYGEEIGELTEEYGKYVAGILGYIAYTYGPEVLEYVIENPEEALEQFVAWYDKYGYRVWPMIDVYLEELGVYDAIEDGAEAVIEKIEEALEELGVQLESEIRDLIEEKLYDATHGEYTVTADSYYVAIDEMYGEDEDGYADKLAEHLGIAYTEINELDEDEIAKADLITVRYNNEPMIGVMIEDAKDYKTVEAKDWSVYVGEVGAEYVQQALAEVKAMLAEQDLGTMGDMALVAVESYAYEYVGHMISYIQDLETISEINPDALVISVGMNNALADVVLTLDEEEIALGEYIQYVVDAANLEAFVYVLVTGNAIYVDAPAVETEFDAEESADVMDFILNLIDEESREVLLANDDGHEYIKEQILGALTITYEGLLGDANSDGVVDYVDAIYVLEYDAKLRTADELAYGLCDVNGDGEVDYVDAIFILEYDAKLITKFPAAV